MAKLPLGKTVDYPEEYAPGVLFPVPRADARSALGLTDPLPFHGVDTWNAWELTWLDAGGRPTVATATMVIDASSPNIVESKSLKLYLGSFAMSRYEDAADVEHLIAADIANVVGAAVDVTLHTGPNPAMAALASLPGRCVDDLPIAGFTEDVDAGLLRCTAGASADGELHSHLLRSLCPVTGQPDYGSLLVRFEGAAIDPASLLAYIVSFRRHNDFHEACVERMFVDILARCGPHKLTVSARYTRRGGIDINPFRTNFGDTADNGRLWRQ
jgi:7-cyano-7-deazaguanine reductase